MSTKERIREKALELGFEAAGFTGVEPLDVYIQEVQSRPEMYAWVNSDFFSTLRGASPGLKYPWARSMVVLVRNYYRKRFPTELEGLYGRCYMVDERKVHGEEHAKIIAFLKFLRSEGIEARFDGEVPARMAAARAGIVTYGKNCFVFARDSMTGSSWLESLPLMLDVELEPDQPSIELDCPPECKDRCIKACPTGALYEPLKMNPFRCIAFQTYYGEDITPLELREPMGTWIYGCDRCQEACPRNRPLMRQELPVNDDLQSRVKDFFLPNLLRMDQTHYQEKVWPQFFYMPRERIDRWQMNAARALGNQGNSDNIPELERSLSESPYDNVRGMSAWALSRIGGASARNILEKRRGAECGMVAEEIDQALSLM
jgi:epoxyqueuosine reductase